MAEWLYEAGIGEARAVLVENNVILEAAIELEGGGPRAGAILPARFFRQLSPGRRGLVRLDGGEEALLEPIPSGLSEGQDLLVEIVREALVEPGRPKRARARPATPGSAARTGPSLRARLGGNVVEPGRHGPDRLEAAGWSELIEEAATGEIAFPGGGLRLSLTPAMTLFDVDGTVAPADLMIAGAAATARAIRRMDIGGSIGVDLPTVEAKAPRLAAAAAIDAILPQPFERTAVNGFGFLQIVRRRPRASLPELLREEPAAAAARALLRRAERTPGAGPRTLVAAPAVIAILAARPGWQAALARRIGAQVALRADPALAISAAYVHTEHSLAP